MATRRRAVEKRPAPRLYLVTDPVGDADAWARTLAEACGAADVAAVLLRLRKDDQPNLAKTVERLAPAVQGGDTALLIEGDPDAAVRAGANGAHLAGLDALRAALPRLKPGRIAGAGALRTRHDAMLAAEAGADYVMFGEPAADGSRPPFAAVAERLAWWSALIEVPCVGFAGSMDEVEPLVAAGADFVALGAFVWDDPRGAAAAVARAGERLGSGGSV
jgi:thiamine-phosphate pyrophosphorylase